MDGQTDKQDGQHQCAKALLAVVSIALKRQQ